MTLNKTGLCGLAIAVLSSDCAADAPVDRVASALLRGHNHERIRKQLEPLTLSPKLCEAARAHAQDMALHQTIGHTGSDGSTIADRVKRVGYVARRAGENCAEGQWTVGEVMAGWMRSPGHRANILAKFTEMGAGWARDDQGTIYWCVDFGIPRFGNPKPPLKPDDMAAAVVKEINRDRQAGRMVLLHPEPTLRRAAMALSAAMAANDSLEIDGDPVNRIDKKTLQGRDVRVKSTAHVTTPERAAKELLGEEADQLESFREIGVGYAVAKNGTRYWCAIFAKPGDVDHPAKPE